MPEPIYINKYDTPIGEMIGCADSYGICVLEFSGPRQISERLNRNIQPGSNQLLDQLGLELNEYFAGKRWHFSVLLNPAGTEFQVKVWEVLKEIPFGETRTYMQQAEKINNIKAIRAVASANGKNPISIIIPCHRVIGSDGRLTGYGGGMERKQWLLDFERANSGKATQKSFEFK
jgi:AraC family transcriptional regulator of adaptative response/methylated-DNA-[protein]-cysteine methyltransferase